MGQSASAPRAEPSPRGESSGVTEREYRPSIRIRFRRPMIDNMATQEGGSHGVGDEGQPQRTLQQYDDVDDLGDWSASEGRPRIRVADTDTDSHIRTRSQTASAALQQRRPVTSDFTARDRNSLNRLSQYNLSPNSSSPSSRRSSCFQRMGARLLPRYSTANSTDSEEDGREEGRAVRRRLADRRSMPLSSRFSSSVDNLRPSNRHSTHLTPPPQTPPLTRSPNSEPPPVTSQVTDSPTFRSPLHAQDVQNPTEVTSSHRRRSRLSTIRNSMSSIPFGLFTSPSRGQSPRDSQSFDTSQAPTTQRNTDSYLPQIPTTTLGLDLDPSSPSRPVTVPNSIPSSVTPNRLRRTTPPPSELGLRRLPAALRGGPTRPRPGEDQAAMLSRLLSHAAALTAVSLVGNNHNALTDAHDVGGDNADGSFEGFLQALQNGRLAAALRNGGSESNPNSNGDGSMTPVNFFRMFRFGATSGNRNRNDSSPGSDTPSSRRLRNSSTEQSAPETPSPPQDEGRMIPVIIVGIRSMNAEEGAGRENGANTPPFFDMLQDLAMEEETPRARGSFLRRTDGRSRFSRSRRSSIGSAFPPNHDSQRQHRNVTGTHADMPAAADDSLTALPTVLSDSPPGPHPPPSTPADLSLSALSSGTSTPIRQPSFTANQLPGAIPNPREQSSRRQQTSTESLEDETAQSTARGIRRRRLSDSEFARYRNSSRRNGFVGDSGTANDSLDEDANRPRRGGQNENTNRSWIIYVLGGSYPEDHPILTTPSLFTDSPSYEDMLLLATLLGPAKPPVATEEDIASASGLWRVSRADEELVAMPIDDDTATPWAIAAGERCLVCLCDYFAEEELRKLKNCEHFFHRECIDEWLTTGRNSCPLCRSQGVDEKKAPAQDGGAEQGESSRSAEQRERGGGSSNAGDARQEVS